MTSLTFTGSLEYIPYTIERYEEKGYELVRYRIIKNRKFGELIEVTMDKMKPMRVEVYINGQWIGVASAFNTSMTIETYTKTELQERLLQALEREDYELAAILRDKIKEL